MLQRQLRVGDIVDDYCPRERRVSDHAVVAMVGEAVRQTRCTTCDAEHVYKGAKVPASRKKKVEVPLPPKAAPAPVATIEADDAGSSESPSQAVAATSPDVVEPAARAADTAPAPAPPEPSNAGPEDAPPSVRYDGPVHRRLIRATLPRVEGQEVTRPIPEFTMHRVPAGRGGFQGKNFKQGAGNHHRPGGRSAHGMGDAFGGRGHGGGQGQGRAGNRPQGGHGGRHSQHGSPSGSGRRKKH